MLGSVNHWEYCHSLPHQSPSCNLSPYTPHEELLWGTLRHHSPLCSCSSAPQIGPASVPLWRIQVGTCCLTLWQRPPLLGRGPQQSPHGNPLCFIAGGVIGQEITLKEQSPGYAHKVSIRLANTEPCGGQH